MPCDKLSFLNYGCVNNKISSPLISKPFGITAVQMRHFHLKYTANLFFVRAMSEPVGELIVLPQTP